MAKKVLYLLSSSFPFGNKEPLIQQEVDLLSKDFDAIIIICSEKGGNKQHKLPANCQAVYFPASTSWFQKLIFTFQLLISSIFWTELKTIKKVYQINLSLLIFKTMLSSYTEARRFKKQVSKLKKKLNLKNHQSYYYAWWSRYQSISLAMLKKQDANAKLFIRMHGYDLYFERHPSNYLPFRPYLFQHATAVLFISDQGKKYISDKFQNSFNNHFVCRLGTQNNRSFSPINPGATLNLVSCSNIIPLKRIHLIVEALSLIPHHIQINWKHFGEGPLLEELKKLATSSLANQSNITYSFEGFISNSDLLEYFATKPVNLFINVSETEGIPISIMEANSFGIPALATKVGGVAELVKANNGYLIDVSSTSKIIAEKIIQHVNLSKTERIELQKNAYQNWTENYNAVKNCESLRQFILNL